MVIVKVRNQYVVSSFVDGVCVRREPTLLEEAIRSPMAVGARLSKNGELDSAVEVIELLCGNDRFEQAGIVDSYFKK